MSLQTSYYRNVILSIHRGWKKGVFSNAKPLYLLMIIKGIEDGDLLGNRIPYNKEMSLKYQKICKQFELWELLQDKSVREEYKEAIITHYLKTE